MNKTHGDVLHSQSTTNGPTLNDLVYRQRPEDTTTGGISSNKSHGGYQLPRGEMGWICPVCGRGLAPSTSYCPCNVNSNIAWVNGGLQICDVVDGITSTPPEAYYTTTATTAKNNCNDSVYGAHYDKHN